MDQPPDNPDRWARVARMAELGVMTSALLHELRQPLFAIKALAEMTAVEGGCTVTERMESLLRQVGHIEELVGHYGGLGRDDDSTLVFDARLPIQLTLNMFRHRARRHRVELRTELGGDALWVRGRESAIRQIAINLLQNAMDAVDGRDERVVAIRAGSRGDMVFFEVKDTGVGIPKHKQAEVFEPFYTSKPVGRGTGLGLHITRLLVEGLGGGVDLASEDGVGTRLMVSIPQASPGS